MFITYQECRFLHVFLGSRRDEWMIHSFGMWQGNRLPTFRGKVLSSRIEVSQDFRILSSVTGWLTPDVSIKRSDLIFKGRNVQEELLLDFRPLKILPLRCLKPAARCYIPQEGPPKSRSCLPVSAVNIPSETVRQGSPFWYSEVLSLQNIAVQ